MRISSVFFSLVLVNLGLVASALAVPKKFEAQQPKALGISALKQVLSREDHSKFAQLKKMGPHVFGDLRQITFDSDQVLSLRWKAFMAMVRLGEREAIPEVRAALDSSDWFLRDAALRVLPLLDKEMAYKSAMNKLDDSALVRTSAVDVLKQLRRPDASEKLWKQLYSRENYIKNQSLWIRRHIVEALADIAPKGSEEKFAKVLSDSDSTLFDPAIRGLERVTGQSLGDPALPALYRRHAWEKWVADARQKEKF